ncbi:aldehyde dehydrogenase [Listeria fleischmannii FSL S10-1203]|uniref:Aldehyde dehydrogenase n=1 Tax=Listeria fleischmannii FSL S10-1203 TaxID=1265822 RepID=W7DML8_9LIST|nr:aldehyde dehydrogenase [Listeria fleischmannii FSL S10-1203]
MQSSEIMNRQKSYFDEGHTKSYLHRKTTLENLKMLLRENENLFLDALQKDLGKSSSEAYMTEIGIIYEEISFALKHLKKMDACRKSKNKCHASWIERVYPQRTLRDGFSHCTVELSVSISAFAVNWGHCSREYGDSKAIRACATNRPCSGARFIALS